MISSLRFTRQESREIQANWGSGSRAIANLEDLRVIFGLHEQFDYHDLERIGLLASFLCWADLERSGSHVSESSVMRTLDEYDFVLNDHRSHEAFLRGLREGVDMLRKDRETFESRVWQKLV